MAKRESGSSCVVCCHDTNIWAVGECNHPTCLLCCARLRVLCCQNDCPVCRLNLKQVAVVSVVMSFRVIPFKQWRYVDWKHHLFFQSEDLFMAFQRITEYRCKLCPPHSVSSLWKNFNRLQDHVSRAHQLHFCEICVKNLKLFPSEFKLYTRPKLMAHRRTGDAEDSSYKGHPLCKFCDDRYLDNEALHLHLRRRHFWCHFCEADGKQDFYPDIEYLRSHFRKEHYLCEEGQCYEDVLSAAFRNEIDLKAHLASVHSKGMSKAEVKKMRYLPVDFSVSSTAAMEEDESVVSVNRRRAAVPVRGMTSAHLRDPVRSRGREERELAVAMSASLHEAKEKEKKAGKRPPSGRKKVCAQKELDPPPGFDGSKKSKETKPKNDGVKGGGGGGGGRKGGGDGGGKKGGGDGGGRKGGGDGKGELTIQTAETVSVGAATATSGDVGEPLRQAKTGSKSVGLKNKDWPSLKTGDGGGGGGSGGNSAAGDIAKSASSSPPPVTPPPGFAKAVRLLQPPSLESANPPKKSAELALSFPPLPSEIVIATSLPPSASSSLAPAHSRSIGGSKVFEDIRRALDYDKEKFKDFQTLSGWFRSGEITLWDYDKRCRGLFGHHWSTFGPLVAKVMPQGDKREELMALFSAKTPSVAKSKGGRKKAKKPQSNAWESEGGDSGGGGGGGGEHSSAMVSEEDYPSLSAASKLPPQKNSNTTFHNAWNFPVHT